jgi:hypothetical protein
MNSFSSIWKMNRAMKKAGWSYKSSSDPKEKLPKPPVYEHTWKKTGPFERTCTDCGCVYKGARRPPDRLVKNPGKLFSSPFGYGWDDPCNSMYEKVMES